MKVEEPVGVDNALVLVDFGRWGMGIDLLFWYIGGVMQ
jgi:hypothetical protein